MGNLRMELEKLICYTEGRDAVTAKDMDAVCTTSVSNHIFDMVRAVAEKNQEKAMDLYMELLALKEPHQQLETLQALMALFMNDELMERLQKVDNYEDYYQIIKESGLDN